MGLRPTHGDESALLRFIDSKQGYSRLSRECNDNITAIMGSGSPLDDSSRNRVFDIPQARFWTVCDYPGVRALRSRA